MSLHQFINARIKKPEKINGFRFFEIYVNSVFVKLNNLENYETPRLFNSN